MRDLRTVCPYCGRYVVLFNHPEYGRVMMGHRTETPHTPETPWCEGGGRGTAGVSSAATVYGVTLVKKHDGFGKARGGTEYRAVFREARESDDAVARAYRMLKRDHPFENPMAWEVGRVG